MSTTYSEVSSLFSNIAAAIKEKTNDTRSIVARNFPDAIRAIEVSSGGEGTSEIEYNNSQVTSIPAYTFYGIEEIVSVNCANIRAIGDSAFENCSNLKQITIASCTRNIGKNAFKNLHPNCVINAKFNSKPSTWDSQWNPNNYPVNWTGSEAIATYDISYSGTNNVVAELMNAPSGNGYRLTISGQGKMKDMSYNTYPAWYTEYGQNISEIVILEGVTSIGKYMFQDHGGLKTVEMANTITSIGYDAFADCLNLLNLTLSQNLTSLPNSCFKNCAALVTVNLPSKITSLDDSCFENCSKLENIDLSKVKTIDTHCFSNCNLKTFTATSLTSSGWYAFSGCKFTSLTIPSSVKLSMMMFAECKQLTTLVIEEGVTTIPQDCFENCTSLTSVTLPTTVNSIDRGAFYNTAWLNRLKTLNSMTIVGNNIIMSGGRVSSAFVPAGAKVYPEAFSGAHLQSITFESGVTSIPSNCCYNCSSLTTINFPDTLQSIGYYGFYNCPSVTSINLPPNVSLEDSCFYNSGIIHLTIPSGTAGDTTMGDSAPFSNCQFLQTVRIESNVCGDEEFSSEPINILFYNCPHLNTLTYADSITQICDNLGGDFPALTTINFPDTAILLGNPFEGTAWYNTQLSQNPVMIINKTLVDIADTVTNLEVPTTVTTIGYHSCAYSTNLTSVIINEGVTSIEDYAFYECSSLTTVNLPSSLTFMGYGVFGYNDNLTAINYNGTKQQFLNLCSNSYTWYESSYNYTVYCSDGNLTPEDVEANAWEE